MRSDRRTARLSMFILAGILLVAFGAAHGQEKATGQANPASPWLDVREHASLAKAVKAIGSTPKTLLIPVPQSVSADMAVPANVHLQFLKGGSLHVASGVTVTINGAFEAPLGSVFTGSGTVTFGSSNTSIAEVYPQWWGAVGDDKNDDTGAIQSAINAARDMGGGEVVITKGTFKTTDTLYLWGVDAWDRPGTTLATRGIHLTGLSRRSSIIHYTGSSVCLWLYTSEYEGAPNFHAASTVYGLHLKGTDKPGSIGLQVSAPSKEGSSGGSAFVDNNCMEHFDIGFYIEHTYGALFSYNKIRYNNTGVQVGSKTGGMHNVNGNRFLDNEISHNRHIGLRIYNGTFNAFQGGLIENNGDEGIYIDRTDETWTAYLTFKNIWIEANQRGKPASNLGQVYLHSTGTSYKALGPVLFDRCFFNSQVLNYHMKLGNTIGLQLIENMFSHPNERIIYRMPDTYSHWAIIRTVNEDQNKVIKGVFRGDTAAVGKGEANDIVGTMHMPHVYHPTNSSKAALTSGIEADARTHSSIASASGVFTTQHSIRKLQGKGKGKAAPGISLPPGTGLIGISAYATQKVIADTTITLTIGGKPTTLKVIVPAGSNAKYQSFKLGDYKSGDDWVSAEDKPVIFTCEGSFPKGTDLHIVAFWRSNRLPVF